MMTAAMIARGMDLPVKLDAEAHDARRNHAGWPQIADSRGPAHEIDRVGIEQIVEVELRAQPAWPAKREHPLDAQIGDRDHVLLLGAERLCEEPLRCRNSCVATNVRPNGCPDWARTSGANRRRHGPGTTACIFAFHNAK